MDLSDIVLTSVEEAEFSRIHRSWHIRTNDTDITFFHVRILAPFSYPDYQTLLREFIDCREADRITVNNKGKWERYYKRRIREEELDRIAAIAASDKIKKGHIELYFHRNGRGFLHTKMKFVEHDSRIVSYELICDPLYAGFLSWQTSERPIDNYIYGLWEPKAKTI
jgi:hypothetical protein